MSAKFLPPKTGEHVKVIGAGLPRTGTNSFCAAIGTLLDGPAYHAGVQFASTRDENHILTMDEAARCASMPPHEKKKALKRLEDILDGYVTTNDPPLNLLIPELMQMYPEAKVICTLRDRDAWAKSMLAVMKTTQPALAAFLFFWMPSLRYLPRLMKSFTHLVAERYGLEVRDTKTALTFWERHHALLEETVPREKLFYFDVKDGWEPLCKILDVPVPEVTFPRLNDAKDVEDLFKKAAIEGIKRWLMVGFGFIVMGTILYILI